MYTKREDNHLTNLLIIEEKLTKKINKYIFFPWFVIYNQILYNNLEISPPYFFKVFINKKDKYLKGMNVGLSKRLPDFKSWKIKKIKKNEVDCYNGG